MCPVSWTLRSSQSSLRHFGAAAIDGRPSLVKDVDVSMCQWEIWRGSNRWRYMLVPYKTYKTIFSGDIPEMAIGHMFQCRCLTTHFDTRCSPQGLMQRVKYCNWYLWTRNPQTPKQSTAAQHTCFLQGTLAFFFCYSPWIAWWSVVVCWSAGYPNCVRPEHINYCETKSAVFPRAEGRVEKL